MHDSSSLLDHPKGGSPGELEDYLYMQAWCLDTINNSRWARSLLDLRGSQQEVTDLSDRLIDEFCVFLPTRVWRRSHKILGSCIWTGYPPHG